MTEHAVYYAKGGISNECSDLMQLLNPLLRVVIKKVESSFAFIKILLTISDSLCEGLCTEPSKHNIMSSTNTSTGQHGRHSQRAGRHVDGDTVALLHAVTSQQVSHSTCHLQQLTVKKGSSLWVYSTKTEEKFNTTTHWPVGDLDLWPRFISLPDQSHSLRTGVHVAVQTVHLMWKHRKLDLFLYLLQH